MLRFALKNEIPINHPAPKENEIRIERLTAVFEPNGGRSIHDQTRDQSNA